MKKKIHIANKVKQKQENDFIMTGLWNEKYISDKCWAATAETASAAAAAAKYQTYLVSHYLPDQSKYGATSNWFVCLHLAFSFRFLAINIFNALTLYTRMQHTHTNTCKQLNRISKWRNAALNNSNCTKEVNLIKWDKGSKRKSITVNKVAATWSQNALMTVIVNVWILWHVAGATMPRKLKSQNKRLTKPFSSHFEPFSKSNYSNSIVPRTTVLFFLCFAGL